MKPNSSLLNVLGLALPQLAQSAATPGAPPCRFALKWTQEELLERPDDFASDLLYWEGKFHQDDIAYNAKNGMSYDGSQINWETGVATEKHSFSAASKEVRDPYTRLHPVLMDSNLYSYRPFRSCSTLAPLTARPRLHAS